MKKLFIVMSLFLIGLYATANQPQSDVNVKVSTNNVKVKKAEPSKTSRAIEATKEATDKSVEATKKFTKKAVKATKNATKKSVDATKDFTKKSVDATKDAFENMNPNKPVTLEELQGKSKIKTLKAEKKELKAAYNSRIRDIDAKIKATEKSTILTDVQRQNTIYTLNKEKAEIQAQRDSAIDRYDKRIKELKNSNK